MITFNKLLDSIESELNSGNWNPEHEKLNIKYYETQVKGILLVPDRKLWML
jgi:hypothetical protein